jgi:adenine-specific DNA-methyltransferase
MAKKQATIKTVEALKHDEATRKNIPTAEYQSVMQKNEQDPVRVAYERRNRDLDPQLIWRGKDEQDWSDLVVHAPPLYIQEKVLPKVLIDDLVRRTQVDAKAAAPQFDLFADFNGIPKGVDKTEFYQHDQNWSNRMILGDSLQVMASLAEREGLRGKVQCIYLDPPYGIKFNSNFQWSTTSRDVKDGNAGHITREPEQVKAFRDTWRDGIHSYLTYLRDRLTVARDLLTDSGSIFVQIGDENVHRVRAVMDEVFGEGNCVSEIAFAKTTGLTTNFLSSRFDFLLWYAKSKESLKFRRPYMVKSHEEGTADTYSWIRNDAGDYRALSRDEKESMEVSKGYHLYKPDNITSQGNPLVDFEFEGGNYSFRSKTPPIGLSRLARAGRIHKARNSVQYVRNLDDFGVIQVSQLWGDTGTGGFTDDKLYVVQTGVKTIQRCILMATDPGDLVLDPTCGSGTSAYVAEQWGRRWITIDTSRVALALARARIMGARYQYYLLADSRDGQLKEAEVTRTAPSSQPIRGDIRQGFVYERVPHITLKSIANNAEIDVIWDKWQAKLEPLRESLNAALKKTWQEWEIPREADAKWQDATKKAHADWWQARIARQKEIDASIAAKAEFEYLYDKPYDDKKKVRVAGPFTVESLSPHRVLGVDENDELIDRVAEPGTGYGEKQTFPQMILENLKTAGVQQAHKEDKITFTALTPWPGELVCAEGRYLEGETEKRAAIFIGPEFGTVTRPDLVAAAREAGDADFDVLIACAFNYEAHATEFSKLGRIPVLKARMNADLHMADDLKNTGKGNLFVIFGEPDIEVVSGLWLVTRDGRVVAHYDSVKELSGLGSLEEINRVGREDLSRITKLSAGREVRAHESGAEGGGVSSSEHRGRSGADGNRRIPPESKRGERLTGGSRNTADSGRSYATAASIGNAATAGRGGGDQQNARRAKALSALKELKPSDFPLALTTSHYTQVTIHGVDVFHPQTGEVRSDGPDGIACWFIDTDYNEESFFVRHAYFLGANDPYSALKTTLKAEINEEVWNTLNSDTSRAFSKPKSGRIAVKVINHLGDEVMKVFKVDGGAK